MSMQRLYKQFHGKIMLFGEYSVMTGSEAVLIPYKGVHATLNFAEGGVKEETIVDSNLSLKSFAWYLSGAANDSEFNDLIDIARFTDELDKGLYLDSTIPANYGLGSSGALCSAVFEEYGIGPKVQFPVSDSGILRELKRIFSGLESFFHGFSSGADPLCIYTGSALVVDADGQPGILDVRANPFGGLSAFLINTHRRGHTGPLVEDFQCQMNNTDKRYDFISHYIPHVNKAVEQLVAGNLSLETVLEISARQMIFFDKLIPRQFLDLWNKGIETGLYACKLCGSGGGGMILGFTRDIDKTKDFLTDNYNLSIIQINEV